MPITDLDGTIRSLLQDSWATVLPACRSRLVPRDLSLGKLDDPAPGNLVKVIAGMRRSGKTFRLFQAIDEREASGVEPERICYFNFDDDRIRPYAPDVISRVLETFFEMEPTARAKGAYLLFDEVQDVPGWGVTLRRIVDTEKCTVLLTGSSSRLLSSDLATEFRGRAITYELLPYGFRESLRANGREPAPQGPRGKEEETICRAAFKNYLAHGGFPATYGREPGERVQMLQSYAQMTVARDVLERNRFSNPSFVSNLARIAVSSSARDFSISRINHMGKSSGYSPGRAAIASMIEALEDAHLLYGVYQFTHSAQKLRKGGYKLYAADPGLMVAMSPATSDGMPRALETSVYLELRRRFPAARAAEISLAKLPSGKEVDFVVGDEAFGVAYGLYQVCYALGNGRTKDREIGALVEGMQAFDVRKGTIVTLDEEDEIETDAGMVHVVPAWKWMLDPNEEEE